MRVIGLKLESVRCPVCCGSCWLWARGRRWQFCEAVACWGWRKETQTMSHIVEYCPLTKLNGGLSQLHSADEDAVFLLINYGSWHAYEEKKKKKKKATIWKLALTVLLTLTDPSLSVFYTLTVDRFIFQIDGWWWWKGERCNHVKKGGEIVQRDLSGDYI